MRLQEEQSQAFREARRSRTVAKLIREAHRVADRCETPEEIGGPLLEVIVENTLCDRAALLMRDGPDGAGIFRVTHAIGFGAEPPAGRVVVPGAPPFFFTTARTVIESPAYEMTGILRLPYVLWAFDRASGSALVLGNQSESNISRPFETGDQELAEGALSVYIDVVLRKQAEHALRAAKATAEEASALRARFIATLSHELRTPLNAVIGFSDMLMPQARYQPSMDQRADYARQINESGRALLELINNILDYSSLSKVAPTLKPQWTRATRLVAGAVGELAALAIERQVVLEAADDEALLELNVDPARFRQVLNNLVGNAVKFTPAGGRVVVQARRRADGAGEILVRDSGIGMSAGDIPRALEPFQQIDGGYSRHVPGTGLGLPIAKGLAEAHGGTLEVESQPGFGTTVRVVLPPEQARLAEDGAA